MLRVRAAPALEGPWYWYAVVLIGFTAIDRSRFAFGSARCSRPMPAAPSHPVLQPYRPRSFGSPPSLSRRDVTYR
jgi:hypothetical protein